MHTESQQSARPTHTRDTTAIWSEFVVAATAAAAGVVVDAAAAAVPAATASSSHGDLKA
jgi:hypothetical protein